MPRSLVDILLCRAALAACGVLLAACAAAPGAGSAKLALVIGNGAYENAPALANPTHDADDMCAALRKLGFTTLCHTNLRDRAEFEASVAEYVRQLGPNSVGVVYYSGHGVQVGDANFLIPTQVQPSTAAENPLRVLYGLEDLYAGLRQKQTRLQLVILDACRTDLFAQAPGPASARGASATARPVLIRSLEAMRGVGNGLAPITHAPLETMVFYATASKEAASDGRGRNGPLTKHILRHIGDRGQTLTEFFGKVTKGVVTETENDYHHRQTPYTYGSITSEFCFAGCRGDIGLPGMP